MNIAEFIDHYFERFNARELKDAARAYKKHIDGGGKMMLTMAGAMSTAGMGKIVSEMIRAGKVHAISTTGANLEEDIFRLVARSHYVEVPNYRDLTPDDEDDLRAAKLCRITDICIPEEEAINKIERIIEKVWDEADDKKESHFPHEYLWSIIDDLEVDPMARLEDSWVYTAREHNVPIFTPGWEDSTLGNMAASMVVPPADWDNMPIKNGLETMAALVEWYTNQNASIGFFQIGGGIAGDFPICVVPMMRLELERKETPLWGYFCQISDSPTSYGSYSGAVPNEKITWDKLSIDTPRFMIESDATIVAPLLFKYLLESE